MLNFAIVDLKQSVASWRLWTLLGWLEVRQRYARSSLGPFWLTISMGVMIGTIGVVYGALFGQKMSDYLPFLAISLVMWTMLSSTVSESSNAYIQSGTYIRQASTPKLIYILQVVWRNLVILTHNFVIAIVLLGVYGVKSWETLPIFIPALMVYILNAMWIAMVAALLSARFRDLPQIIAALIQITFYVTPVLYRPSSLTRFAFIVEWNPLAHLLALVRDPLIGEVPSLLTWEVCIGMAVIGWLLALTLTSRYLKRIPYWI